MTNGRQFLIYTPDQGGVFEVYGAVDKSFYDAVVRERKIVRMTWQSNEPEVIIPYFVMLLNCEENHDFGLGRSRDTSPD